MSAFKDKAMKYWIISGDFTGHTRHPRALQQGGGVVA